MKKMLPFQFTNYLFTYNYGIHYYGVLLNNPEGIKLLYNQYIIPYFFDDNKYQELNYYFLSDSSPVELDPNNGLPPIFEKRIVLNKESTKSLTERKSELINLVKYTIDADEYFIGWWDESYIPKSSHYGRQSFSHDYCIIGYDDCCFYCVGYYFGYPKVISVAFNDFFKANESLSINHAMVWTINQKYIFNLDLKIISKGIKSYISGIVPNTEKRDYSLHVFGKNVLIKLSEIIEKDNCIDIRFVHTLKQQKFLMEERTKYIFNSYHLIDDGELQSLSLINKQMQRIFNMCLKLNITKSNDTSVRIARELRDIVNKEEVVYLDILDKISILL